MSTLTITIELDGTPRTLTVEPHLTLLRALRNEGIWSVRFGSDTGETGAAAVLLDGRLASADVILAAAADGHAVTTVETLNQLGDELHPIQKAFMVTGALQSGYSVGPMMLGTLALCARNPNPSEAEIRDMLSGILDRETAHVKVVEAVQRSAALMRGDAVEEFRPIMLTPLTDGTTPCVYDPASQPVAGSKALPRVIPSVDVPIMSVVGKPEIKF